MAETETKTFLLSDVVKETAESLEKTFPPKDIQGLLQQTKKFLDEVERLKIKWEQMNEIAFQENPIYVQRKGEESPHASRTATAYKLLWGGNENEKQYQEILSVIVKAEVFLDKVRQYFTGKSISYTVGVRYENQLYEYNLTLMDVLSNAVVGIDAKNQGLKLRIAASKSALIKAYGELKSTGKNAEVIINEDKQQLVTNDKLYEDIYSYWESNDKTVNGIKLNEGQLYETYRFILAEGKYKHIDFSSGKDLEYLTRAAERTIKNTASGRQGGDVQDAQVKFFNASFASLGEIWRTLTELVKILTNFVNTKHKKEFKQGMKKLFTKREKDIDSIDKSMQKDIKKHIDEVIRSISGVTLS